MTAQERKLQQMAQDLIKNLWTEAQSVATRTEKQVVAFVNRLAERGNVTQEEALRIADEQVQRLRKSGEEVSRFMDQRLENMAHMLKMPSRADIDDLRQRIENLNRRVERVAARLD